MARCRLRSSAVQSLMGNRTAAALKLRWTVNRYRCNRILESCPPFLAASARTYPVFAAVCALAVPLCISGGYLQLLLLPCARTAPAAPAKPRRAAP